jgi:hypothetical protein
LSLRVRQISSASDIDAFIRLPWRLYANDPAWRPPLRSERRDFLTPSKNPYFEHAKVALFLAEQGGRVVGRISAQVDQLVLDHMEPGLGQWGLFECENDPDIANALIGAAEGWLQAQGMTRALGPISMSIWDEPGLLVQGFEHQPLLMMGHHRPEYQTLIEQAGYQKEKDLYAYNLDITVGFPDKIQRIVAAGDAQSRIRLRPAYVSRYSEEIKTILTILNDAWSDNWGYIPLTASEIAYAAKSLKPLVRPNMVQICEYDGVPSAFMITFPDLNEWIADLNGSLLPLGWAKLLWRLKYGRTDRVRVPLMGVLKTHQRSRQGAMMAFMLIEHIRHYTHGVYGARYGELSWILEDNLPMRNILETIGCYIYKTYRIYGRKLSN